MTAPELPTAGAGGAAPERPDAAERARYAVLLRVGPALKHDMVANLQAVAMMAEVMGSRLDKGLPAPDEIQRNLARMHRLAREAVNGCLQVATWLEPPDDEAIALHEGVQECVALLRSNFVFRGFSLDVQVPASGFMVSRVSLRNLLVGSLLALTDGCVQPCAVLVGAELQAAHAVLTLQCGVAQADTGGMPLQPGYRRLAWADVVALAAADSVEVTRTRGSIVLHLPRLLVTTPLKIAPL